MVYPGITTLCQWCTRAEWSTNARWPARTLQRDAIVYPIYSKVSSTSGTGGADQTNNSNTESAALPAARPGQSLYMVLWVAPGHHARHTTLLT